MCVVTFLPLPDGFVLTSNRDEHISRPTALSPQQYTTHHPRLIYPKDPQGGGTWLASSDTATVCLLNGAFENHTHQPPLYNGEPRKSRGLVVLEFFDYLDPKRFAEAYNFSGIEPFTLIMVKHGVGAPVIHELRWNGLQVYLREMPTNQPHIWSSVTLYTQPMAELRKAWLAHFLYEQVQYTADDLFEFHLMAGDGDPHHDFVMNRPEQGVRTVSITQVRQTDHSRSMRYRDLVTGAVTQLAL